MSQTSRRIKTHKKAKDLINSFYDNNTHCLIIHYSCESFYDIIDGRTPRITSIAVKFLHSAQTKSFSIHKIAELQGLAIDQIHVNYNSLEKEMLTDFYNFVKEHLSYTWIHWNMRDINFGFEAIKHRAITLGSNFNEIPDERKYDLARLLTEKYSKKYASHPRLKSIIDLNNISSLNFLLGEDEAEAFQNKEYVKLHQSTLSKVDVMENILKRAAEEDLKTSSNLLDIYGISPQGLYDLAKDHWLYSLVLSIIGIVVAYILS